MKREELALLTKKELVLEYKREYNTDRISSSRSKALIIEDIMEIQNDRARNKAIDNLPVTRI